MAAGYSEETSTVSATTDLVSHSDKGCARHATDPLYHSSGRSPLATLTGVQILGTGVYLPETVVCNEDLTELGCDPDWIIQRTGIRQRRRAAAGEATSDLATRAAERCLDDAGVSARDVDMILLATMTPDMPMPSAACSVPIPAITGCGRGRTWTCRSPS